MGSPQISKDVLRLAGLLASVALATSRLGLIAHELVGHGGAALAVGAHVTDVQLFWFAGGWIRYSDVPSTSAALVIAMAGIALELVVGATLAVAVRPGTLGRRIVRGIGAALVLHASWYLATGAFNGFGDGLLLYRVLGDARVPVAIAAGLVTCAAAFLGAREVLGALADTLPRHRVLGTAVALVLAGGLHAGLTIGELRARRDTTYAQTMQPEQERVVARELARWVERQPAASEDARQAERARLESEHRTFPFVWLLAAATALAGIAGAWRARPGDGQRISRRLLATAVIAGAVAISAVIGIDAVL